jgi:hypothetical protein
LHASAVLPECRNCGTHLGTPPGKFCPECGQDTAPHPPSAGEFLHEFVGHYVALEGKLWRTLGLLFFKPGSLTREYIEGRKQRYVLPLRLYLTASLLFFVIVKLIGTGDVLKVKMTDAERAQMAAVTQTRPDLNKPATQIFQCDGSPQCDKIRVYLDEKFQGKTMGSVIEQVNRRMYSAAPYAMFALLPFFAGLTYLLYRRRRLMYGEHLVYAFHVHSFAFFSMLAMALLAPAADIIFLVGLVYYFIALQRFFGGRWWMNALRYGIISLAYVLAFGLTVVGGFIVAALY